MIEIKNEYDAIVIGSGLAGMTAANMLAKSDNRVLLCEHHFNLGGLATWFNRKGGHIFDVSLHGFPVGMIKTCRKYWSKEIADSIVQLKEIRFDNPQFSFTTTFDINDFKEKLVDVFKIERTVVDDFFTTVRGMDYFQENKMTARELFDKFFPGRSDVVRLLMEPITYANGSTLDDPAISYGIVFSNFMSKGVFTFEGGTDKLIGSMKAELEKNGVDIALKSRVEKILTAGKKVCGALVNGREIKCKSVVSNANIVTTVNDLCGRQNFSAGFLSQFDTVRINNSSSQVYMGIRKGEKIDFIGDLIFTSTAPEFSSSELIDKNTSSRTFSVYYPKTRPGHEMYSIVSSTNSNYDDWAQLSGQDYLKEKEALIERSIKHLEKYVPDIRKKIDYVEAATPLTFKRYTLHPGGSSFGTKFEGLKPSMEIGNEVGGLFHTGSVGIIMSGWLGTVNYGVIVANNADRYIKNLS